MTTKKKAHTKKPRKKEPPVKKVTVSIEMEVVPERAMYLRAEAASGKIDGVPFVVDSVIGGGSLLVTFRKDLKQRYLLNVGDAVQAIYHHHKENGK